MGLGCCFAEEIYLVLGAWGVHDVDLAGLGVMEREMVACINLIFRRCVLDWWRATLMVLAMSTYSGVGYYGGGCSMPASRRLNQSVCSVTKLPSMYSASHVPKEASSFFLGNLKTGETTWIRCIDLDVHI